MLRQYRPSPLHPAVPVKDLTKDSITLHILAMAAPAAITMLVQMAHQVITLYFVSRLGADAVAGVTAAGNAGFIVGAATQILNVGTSALVAHSAGRKDSGQISLLVNQALGLAGVTAIAVVCMLCAQAHVYMASLSADEAVVDAGVRFLWWVSPGFALLFPMTALVAALRGIGVVRAPMLIFTFTIILDAAFAAVLIPGRGFIPALGIEGAAIASTLSLTIGFIWMLAYFRRAEPGIPIERKRLLPRIDIWRRIFAVGSPAAAELVLMFLSVSVIYLVIRDQGASVQAGFGIGYRVLQLLLLPGLAVSLAAAPIAGQNFGAGNSARVREVFRTTAILSSVVMLFTTVAVLWQPDVLLRVFEADGPSAATARSFLQLMSWSLVAQGLVFNCAFMFQALGNTMPALLSATVRFVVFSVPALWLSRQSGFHADQVWYLLTASTAVQAGVSLWLVFVEFRRRLPAVVEENHSVVPRREANNPTTWTGRIDL
jgi:putative MATE family efflux protein